jgi:hypothetical protein
MEQKTERLSVTCRSWIQFCESEFASAINKDLEQAMRHENLETRVLISEMYSEEPQIRGHRGTTLFLLF